MAADRMHAGEVETSAGLVRRLLAAQFPEWAVLPIAPVTSAGTDNALYRLGDGLCVRLPRIHWATGQAAKDFRWLPKLAPHLPFAIPEPLATGEPAEGYPWEWAVYRWLEGESLAPGRVADMDRLACDLAQFIAALRRIDTTGGPESGPANFGRGVPLARRDGPVRTAIAALAETCDPDLLTAVWEESRDAPAWDGPPTWLHGDLIPGNVLVKDGRLTAVIDFGALGVGDPACDLQPAWHVFDGSARETFRAALEVDDASWLRGRGWSLSVALIALPYYKDTNSTLAAVSRYAIEQVLADFQRGV